MPPQRLMRRTRQTKKRGICIEVKIQLMRLMRLQYASTTLMHERAALVQIMREGKARFGGGGERREGRNCR